MKTVDDIMVASDLRAAVETLNRAILKACDRGIDVDLVVDKVCFVTGKRYTVVVIKHILKTETV